MSPALNKPKLDNLAGDTWKPAERLRGKFKPRLRFGIFSVPTTEKP